MEIDFSLAPPDATHYMIQAGAGDLYYWFFSIKKNYLVAVATHKGKHTVAQRHHVEKKELEKYLEGHYGCVCTEMNIVLENE